MSVQHPLGGNFLGGWTVLGDAPKDVLAQLPPPAAGRYVLALSPPALDGRSSMQGKEKWIPGREHLALLWDTPAGRPALLELCSEGLLLMGRPQDAPWLPDGWAMDVYPAGWTLRHLEGWFACALSVAGMENRGDIPPGSDMSPSYAPTPRGLVTHAHLIVRHLALPGTPAEPRGVMDRAGCIAELRDLIGFFRRVGREKGPEAGLPASVPACEQEVAKVNHQPRVVLRGRDEPPVVLREEMPVLTDAEYDTVAALLKAGKNGLSKDRLDAKSGRAEARKHLTHLREKHAGWAAVIRMPGKAGRGGYRIE